MSLTSILSFHKIHHRTALINKNILATFLFKGGSVLITFLMVPLTINYIDKFQYGIWITMSSLIYWINIFDFGIANGLKNQITLSLASNTRDNLRSFVSSSYLLLSIIGVAIFGITVIINSFIDWNSVLNIPVSVEIGATILILVGFVCSQLVLQLLDAVVCAAQQPYISSLILFLGQLTGLSSIYFLTHFVPGSLVVLVFAVAGSTFIVSLVASFYIYGKKFKHFAPSIRLVKLSSLRSMLKFGGEFFVIQIGAIIVIYSNNILIAKIVGAEAVTLYSIPFRLFSVLTLIFIIVLGPYWSAFTEAYAKKDYSWIKKSIKTLRLIWCCLALMGGIVLVFSETMYKIWLDDIIYVPFSVSFCVFLNVLAYTWHNLHTYFLNGVGKIRLQLFVVVAGVLLNIFLAFFLGNQYGLNGIIVANSITFVLMGVVYTIQYQKIISGSAKCIWAK